MGEAQIQERRNAVAAVLREQILDAFAHIALREGYAQTTIAGIAREARISKTTFYAHFADKEAAYLELQGRGRAAKERAFAAARAGLDPSAPPQDVVRTVVRAYLEATFARPSYLAQMQFEAQVPGPAARQARADAGVAFAAAIVALAKRHAAPGGLPLTPELALLGLAGTSSAVVSTAPSGTDAVRGLEDHLVDFWLRLLGLS